MRVYGCRSLFFPIGLLYLRALEKWCNRPAAVNDAPHLVNESTVILAMGGGPAARSNLKLEFFESLMGVEGLALIARILII